MCQECKWRNQDSSMCQVFCEKSTQGPKIFREVAHIYENVSENIKFGGGSKIGFLGLFEPQLFGPKLFKICMVGAFGWCENPQNMLRMERTAATAENTPQPLSLHFSKPFSLSSTGSASAESGPVPQKYSKLLIKLFNSLCLQHFSECFIGNVVEVWANGQGEIISNEFGNEITPSVETFNETERLLGDGARGQLLANPESIKIVKRKKNGEPFVLVT